MSTPTSQRPALMVACPTCKTQHLYDVQSASRPFCSERCKGIDLGAWSDESYRVEVQPDPEKDFELLEEELLKGEFPWPDALKLPKS